MNLLPRLQQKISYFEAELIRQTTPRRRRSYETILARLRYWQGLVRSGRTRVDQAIISSLASAPDLAQADPLELCEALLDEYFPVNAAESSFLQGELETEFGAGAGEFQSPELRLDVLRMFCNWLEEQGYLVDNRPSSLLTYRRGLPNPQAMSTAPYILFHLLDREAVVIDSFTYGQAGYVLSGVSAEVSLASLYTLSKEAFLKSYGDYLRRYLHTEHFIERLVTLLDQNPSEVIPEPDRELGTQWIRLAEYLGTHFARPNYSRDYELYALLNKKFVRQGYVEGLTAELRATICHRLQDIEDAEMQVWLNIGDYMLHYLKFPGNGRKYPWFVRRLAIKWFNFRQDGHRKGLDVHTEAWLTRLAETLEAADHQTWENLLDYMCAHQRRPLDSEARRSLLVKAMRSKFLYFVHGKNATPEDVAPTRALTEIPRLLTQFDRIETLKWENLCDFIEHYEAFPSSTTRKTRDLHYRLYRALEQYRFGKSKVKHLEPATRQRLDHLIAKYG